jgi:hypothetical protein
MTISRLSALLALLVVASLTGCSSVIKIEGEQTLYGRLTVRVDSAWNKLPTTGQEQPYEVWTQEGVGLDHLRLWAGTRSGDPLVLAAAPADGQKPARVPVFRSDMAPDQLASLFEALYALDGSQVQITRLEPAAFAGQSGLRFELAIVRNRDDVHLSVAGWLAVRQGELFAMTYAAPRLGFFRRGLPGVEAVAASARLR